MTVEKSLVRATKKKNSHKTTYKTIPRVGDVTQWQSICLVCMSSILSNPLKNKKIIAGL
jgi:hypothetical protein